MLNELSGHRIAADVPIRCRQQLSSGEFAGDVPQVQITVANRRNFFAANLAKITLFTTCHSIPVNKQTRKISDLNQTLDVLSLSF